MTTFVERPVLRGCLTVAEKSAIKETAKNGKAIMLDSSGRGKNADTFRANLAVTFKRQGYRVHGKISGTVVTVWLEKI